MVAFRKLFPVLAIGALLLGTATTASAQRLPVNLWCVAPMLVFRPWFVQKVTRNWLATLSWFVLVVIPTRPCSCQLPVVLEYEHHQPPAERWIVGSSSADRRTGRGSPERDGTAS